MTEAPAKPFAHLDAPNADLYRAVMGVFVGAKRRFLVHLRPEDVLEALRGPEGPPVEAAAVEAALKQLESWRNLQADPDTSRVTTVDDFYRPRYLYQLTPEGEAAELALAAYDEALGNRGELQSVALEDIRVRLRSLRRQAEEAPTRTRPWCTACASCPRCWTGWRPTRARARRRPGQAHGVDLLIGGRYQRRLGYTWLELGRLTDGGAPAYLTLGCGLKAVAGRGIAGRWFFVTDQRVGADLGLASPAGTARPPPAGDDGGNRHPEATEALW